jgi:hypothetical protein
MNRSVSDFTSVLRDALIEIRTLGLAEAADELEGAVFSAFTTSSELLGESGLAITKFLKDHRRQLPDPVISQLNFCLSEIGKVWPKFRP